MSLLNKIGEDAGVVWRALDKKGEMSVTKLVKETKLSSDEVMMALGWLSRENKVDTRDENGETIISLPREFFF